MSTFPLIFKLRKFSGKVFQNAMQNIEESIKKNGKMNKNIKNANDSVIMANIPDELSRCYIQKVFISRKQKKNGNKNPKF